CAGEENALTVLVNHLPAVRKPRHHRHAGAVVAVLNIEAPQSFRFSRMIGAEIEHAPSVDCVRNPARKQFHFSRQIPSHGSALRSCRLPAARSGTEPSASRYDRDEEPSLSDSRRPVLPPRTAWRARLDASRSPAGLWA